MQSRMSASTFIWMLCSGFVFILVAVTRGFEGALDVALIVVASFVLGFLLLLTLVGLTWKFDYPLWQRLFGPSETEAREG